MSARITLPLPAAPDPLTRLTMTVHEHDKMLAEVADLWPDVVTALQMVNEHARWTSDPYEVVNEVTETAIGEVWGEVTHLQEEYQHQAARLAHVEAALVKLLALLPTTPAA